MTTAAHQIDDTPTALAGLENGKRYVVQNVSNNNVLISEAAAAPDASTDAALVLKPTGTFYLTASVQSFFAWVTAGKGLLVTSEAP